MIVITIIIVFALEIIDTLFGDKIYEYLKKFHNK